MTKQEIKDLVALKIAVQGSAVDAGSALPQILDAIVDAIDEGGGGGSSDPVAITYNELKTLRDGGGLTVGGKYRITDYVATTIQGETQSANHPFDIIVTATAANKLDESASAALHQGDEYFANCDLSKWRLMYSLDNKYWSDPDNGKGVIYRMIDEFENDAPFDFKGIQIKRYTISSIANFAQMFSGLCIGMRSEFNPALNLQLDDSSFAWFYLFSCFDAPEETHQPTAENEYFDSTVKIPDLKSEIEYTQGVVSGNQFVMDMREPSITGDVFISRFGVYDDVDENDNPIRYAYVDSVSGVKLLGGGGGNTFIQTSNCEFTGPVFGNIWSNGTKSYGQGAIDGNVFVGPLYSLGFGGVGHNYIVAFSGNTVLYEMQGVVAKTQFDENIVQSMVNVTFECGFVRGEIGDEIAYATVTAADASKNIEHAYILSGTRGTAATPATITFPYQEARFAQFAARDSNGTVKVWVPADLVS